MSSLINQGGASGTGSMTLLAPNTNSNQTATFPDATGTVMVSGNMPTFSYYQSSAQTLASNTFTKLTFTSSDWDTTSGMYSSSRFTPTVAGYYQINAAFAVGVSATNASAAIYKNGSEFKRGMNIQANSALQTVSGLVYCNGSTDYIEIYGIVTIGQALATGSNLTYFQAAMIRAA